MALWTRLRLLWLALTMKPIRGAEDDPPKDDPKPDPKSDDDPANDPGDDPDDPVEKIEKDDDWQAKARKHERAVKRERKAREEAERKLKEREEGDKSEQDKALDKAREEAKAEAKAEAEKDRRSDRLEVAVTRVATKGVKVGEGDEAKSKVFADSEDALLHVERAIASGDLDEDDIFDTEGKVNTDALTTALADLLDRKPHLAAGDAKTKPGDADTRKGGTADGDLESMSIEEHAARKYPTPTK